MEKLQKESGSGELAGQRRRPAAQERKFAHCAKAEML